jgi:hypothetical protein
VFSELLSFHAKKRKIRKFIRSFFELKCSIKDDEWIEKFINAYKRIPIVFTSITAATIFYSNRNFFIPVIYEDPEKFESSLCLCIIYIFHCALYFYGVIAIELLPIVSVLKLEGLVAYLCQKIEQVTSGNLQENEKKLDNCIKFHAEILK